VSELDDCAAASVQTRRARIARHERSTGSTVQFSPHTGASSTLRHPEVVGDGSSDGTGCNVVAGAARLLPRCGCCGTRADRGRASSAIPDSSRGTNSSSSRTTGVNEVGTAGMAARQQQHR
jgi:hypothetical protein